MMAETNECPNCGHDLKSENPGEGHVERAGALICKKCTELCRGPTPAAPVPIPGVTDQPRQTTKEEVTKLAEELAVKMASVRNEMMWKVLNQPGVIVRTVDGGYYLENNMGQEAVRADLEQALVKAKEWLSPPKS